MNTIAFVAAVVVLGLIVLAKLPGLEHLVRPLIDWLFKFMTWCIENGFAWGIFLFKALWFSHLEVVRNLVLAAETIDPTIAMREQQVASPQGD